MARGVEAEEGRGGGGGGGGLPWEQWKPADDSYQRKSRSEYASPAHRRTESLFTALRLTRSASPSAVVAEVLVLNLHAVAASRGQPRLWDASGTCPRTSPRASSRHGCTAPVARVLGRSWTWGSPAVDKQTRPAKPPPQPRAPRQFPAPACRAAPAQSGAWNEEEPTSPPVRVRVPVLSCLTAISPQWPHPHGVQPVQSVEEQQPTTCKPADTAAPAEHLTPQPRPAASHLRSSVTLGERQVQHPVCSRAGVARSEAAEDAALALAAIPVRLIDQRDDRGGAVRVSGGANHYVHLRGCGCCQARR